MYGWEQRVLVQHYLEQGLTKTAIAERVGVSRRTLYHWLAMGQPDREVRRETLKAFFKFLSPRSARG